MKLSKILSLLVLALALVATPALNAQGVQITSDVQATVGGAATKIIFTGLGSHTRSGVNVIFNVKQLVAATSPLGPLTATLDPARPSDGKLGSTTFPTTHTQNFFLQIQSQNLGTLVSDAPIVLTATIQNCPPNAVYRLVGNPVPFYRQGDPTRQTVLTVNDVASTVTPSTGQSGK